MPSALFRVESPVLHPIAAKPGQFIGWYAARDIVVLRETRHGWQVVRRLGFDNAGALGCCEADGAITCVYQRGGVALPRPLPALPRPMPADIGPLRLA
jgi:hypothetical protein